MPKFFVEKAIEINAPTSKVWDILTSPEHTSEWAFENSGGTEFHIESDWTLGSPVLWKAQDGKVIVGGNVTAVEPNTSCVLPSLTFGRKSHPSQKRTETNYVSSFS